MRVCGTYLLDELERVMTEHLGPNGWPTDAAADHPRQLVEPGASVIPFPDVADTPTARRLQRVDYLSPTTGTSSASIPTVCELSHDPVLSNLANEGLIRPDA